MHTNFSVTDRLSRRILLVPLAGALLALAVAAYAATVGGPVHAVELVSKPTNLTATTPHPGGIVLTWDLSSSLCGLDHHVVTWQADRKGAPLYSKTVEGAVWHTEVKDSLWWGVLHHITLTAYDACGNASLPASVEATPVAPLEPPRDVSAVGGVGRIDVSWSSPASGADVTGYRVQWWSRLDKADKSHVDLGAHIRSHGLVEELSWDEPHVVRVRAMSASGDSRWARATGTSTPQAPSLPGVPQAVSAVPSGDDILVQWSSPDGSDSDVVAYEVRYGAVSGPYPPGPAIEEHTVSAPGAGTSVLIAEHVEAGGWYTVRVRASGAGGFGPWSNLAVVQAAELPNRPPAVVGSPAISGGVAPQPSGGLGIQAGAVPLVVDFTGVFHDPDDDPLSYAVSGLGDPAGTSVSDTMTGPSSQIVTLVAETYDPSQTVLRVFVVASDGNGGSAEFTFDLTVSPPLTPPALGQELPDITLTGTESAVVDISGAFMPVSGIHGPLVYSVDSSRPGVATAELGGEGSPGIVVQAREPGMTEITVSATHYGYAVVQRFQASVSSEPAD